MLNVSLWIKSPLQFFATRKRTIELPSSSLAHSHHCTGNGQPHSTRAQAWFPREPALMSLTEMTMVAGQYDYTLTLLLMPDAEWQSPRYDEEEPLQDTYL
jgi:hypothetical protein